MKSRIHYFGAHFTRKNGKHSLSWQVHFYFACFIGDDDGAHTISRIYQLLHSLRSIITRHHNIPVGGITNNSIFLVPFKATFDFFIFVSYHGSVSLMLVSAWEGGSEKIVVTLCQEILDSGLKIMGFCQEF